MSTLNMLRTYLDNLNVFSNKIPSILSKAMNCISQDTSNEMKLAMATSELISMASQFKKHVELPEGTLVPVNSMFFVLARSGESKDSSVSQLRKALKPTYDWIESKRAKEAEDAARMEAEKVEDSQENWWKFYVQPREILSSTGTLEGMFKFWNSLDESDIGAAYLTVNELGSELVSNSNMKHTLEALAKGYDLGQIPAKIVKADDNQISGIKQLPISSLMFGTQDNILYNKKAKEIFLEEFTSKLARRSFICYVTEYVEQKEYQSIEELRNHKISIRNEAKLAVEELKSLLDQLAESINKEPLVMSIEAEELYDVYLEYNKLRSDSVEANYPISKLATKHLQWKALKLAGALAILDYSDTLEQKHLVSAIRITERFNTYMLKFEKELQKEPYEMFIDYVHNHSVDGLMEISLHDIKKLGYIQNTGKTSDRLKELATLASSCDNNGVYIPTDVSINYEEVEKTSKVNVSFKEVSGTKEERTKDCYDGYEDYETDFEELGEMLKYDYAYTPFKFLNGVRNKENMYGTAKWVVIDVDTSVITDDEVHYMLSDINHHIVRTSDKDNEFKFRVLLELDSEVDIPSIQWKHFIKSIANSLSIEADELPKSSIFFSYSGRDVLSVTDGDTILAKEHIINSNDAVKNKNTKRKSFTSVEKSDQLKQPADTFHYAYNSGKGSRSRNLIRMVYHARDLGGDKDYLKKIVTEANEYMVNSLPDEEVERCILSQIDRLF